MTDKKTIAVVGATGAQGGGLVRAIVADGEFAARAVTRNAGSDKAKALVDIGAAVVAADVDDIQSLKRAFDGAYGAYCVTFFFEHFSPEKELAHAQGMAEAAKHTGVEHVIWSTLEDTRKWVPLDDDRMPTLMEKYKVPHFDVKGEANGLFTDVGVPTTFLQTTFYWENFISQGPQRGEDGKLAITMPMGSAKLSGIAAGDIGKCALAIFKNGSAYIGKTVSIAGEHLTGDQMAAALSDALGQEVGYNDVPPEVYRSFGFPGADDLGNMFQFYRDFNEYFCGAHDLAATRKLNPELLTFKEWLAENAGKIPLE